MQALRDSGLKLRCLTFEHLTVRIFEQKPIALRILKGSLDHVEVLNLKHLKQTETRELDCQLFNKNFGLFLSMAPRLKELTIDLASGGPDDSYGYEDRFNDCAYFSLRYALKNHTWPELRLFHLGKTMVHRSHLMEFLTRHARTLTEVELFDLTLIEGGHEKLFGFCRDNLKLSHFVATGNFTRAVFDENGEI